jgi:hypothetical protein
VQVLDQQIAPPRKVAEQKLDFLRCGRIDLTSLGGGFGTLAPGPRVFERANLMHIMNH